MPIDANDTPMTNVGAIQPVRPVDLFDEAALVRGADSVSRGTNAVAAIIADRTSAKINDIRDNELVSEMMKIDTELSLRPLEDSQVDPDKYESEVLAERNKRLEDKANELLDSMNLSGGSRQKALESFQSVYQGRAEGALRQKLVGNFINEKTLHFNNDLAGLMGNHRYLDAVSLYSEEMASHLSDAERELARREILDNAANHILNKAKLGEQPAEGAFDAIPLMNEEQQDIADLGLVMLNTARENPKRDADLRNANNQYIESMDTLAEGGLTTEEAAIARQDFIHLLDENVSRMVFNGPAAEVDRNKYRQAQIDSMNERLVDSIAHKLQQNGDLDSAVVAIESFGLSADNKNAAMNTLRNVHRSELTKQDNDILRDEVEGRYLEVIEGLMSGEIKPSDVNTHEFDSHEGLTSAAKTQAVLKLMDAVRFAGNRSKARLDISSTAGDHARAAALRDGNKSAFDTELQIRYDALQSPGEGSGAIPMTEAQAMAQIVNDYGMVPPSVAALWKNLDVSNKDEQIVEALPLMRAVLQSGNFTMLDDAGVPEHIISAVDEYSITNDVNAAVGAVRGGAESRPRVDYESHETRFNLAKQALGGLGVKDSALELLADQPLFAQHIENIQGRIIHEGREVTPANVVAMMRLNSQQGGFPLSFSAAGGVGGEEVWMRGQSPEQAVQKFIAVTGSDEDLVHNSIYMQIGRDVAESDIIRKMRASGELSQDAMTLINNGDFDRFARDFLVLEHVGNGYTEDILKELSKPNSAAFHEKNLGNEAMPIYHARVIDSRGFEVPVVDGEDRIHIDPTQITGWRPGERKQASQSVKEYYADTYPGVVTNRALATVGQIDFKVGGKKQSFADMVRMDNKGDVEVEHKLSNAAAISMLYGVATNTSGQNIKHVDFMDGDVSVPMFRDNLEGDFKKEADKIALAVDWLIENVDKTRENNGVPPESIGKHVGAFRGSFAEGPFFEHGTEIMTMFGYGDNQEIINLLLKGKIIKTGNEISKDVKPSGLSSFLPAAL